MDPAIVPDERPIQNPATPPEICFNDPRFAGLVALAECPDPIPSRTRPSNAPAPMVLCLKTWESRSSPGLQNTENASSHIVRHETRTRPGFRVLSFGRFLLTRGGAAR